MVPSVSSNVIRQLPDTAMLALVLPFAGKPMNAPSRPPEGSELLHVPCQDQSRQDIAHPADQILRQELRYCHPPTAAAILDDEQIE